jgi:hypothetical protein
MDMKTVHINTDSGMAVAVLIQQPEQDDQMFNDLVMALILTIANDTGLQLTKVETP